MTINFESLEQLLTPLGKSYLNFLRRRYHDDPALIIPDFEDKTKREEYYNFIKKCKSNNS